MLLAEVYTKVVVVVVRETGGSRSAKKVLVAFLDQQKSDLTSHAALRPLERAGLLDLLDHLRAL